MTNRDHSPSVAQNDGGDAKLRTEGSGQAVTTLADELPREIERVIEVRKSYEELRAMPNVLVEPQIAMMTASINGAIRACATGDVILMLRAYADLKGWAE